MTQTHSNPVEREQAAKEHLVLVRKHIEGNDWRSAVPHAQTALALLSSSGKLKVTMKTVDALSVLGTDALYDGDFDRALEFFQAVIRFIGQATRDSVQNSSRLLPPTDQASPVHKILYLPVEVKAREFESKCLLALEAARLGFHVVIGRSWVLYAGTFADLPSGLIVFKTLNAMDANNIAVAKHNGGHLAAALDEEAFGRSTSVRALKLNIDQDAVENADLILIQGEAHVRTWRQHFDIDESKLVVTGNPKLDVLQRIAPEDRSGDAKPLILFCTMSGNVNPGGRAFAITMRETLLAGANTLSRDLLPDLEHLMLDSAAFELAMIPILTDSVRRAADAFPHADIVVRPHPIEDPALWQDRFAGLTNVRVETAGALTEWLARCDVLVHVAGCGTGVEAALSGMPAIRLTGPAVAPDPDTGLSSEINQRAESPEDVVQLLHTFSNEGNASTRTPELSEYFHQPPSGTAARAVASALENLHRSHAAPWNAPTDSLKTLRERRTSHFALTPFHLQKFPATSADEVKVLLDRLARKFDVPSKIDVAEIEDGLFLISPER